MEKLIRKYNTCYRKKIVENLNKISDNNILIDIFNIIVKDIGHNYSNNRNGIFINLNILSDNCIDELLSLINLLKNNIYIKSELNSSSQIINEYTTSHAVEESAV